MAPLDEVLGDSPSITKVRDKVARLLQHLPEGRRLPPILIQGETGTGKSSLARAMHHASRRANGSFVPVNCANIPDTLLESHLFGHERGAYTDARQAKTGLFQAAHGGTIFLDEVALMSEAVQGKLLTAIEEKTIRRLGSTRSESVDVWVVAASSADLADATRERRFRQDLYHRLAVVTLWLPPLRERGDDITLLAAHFLDHACREYGQSSRRLDADACSALRAHDWPGNIRELANVMERVALFTDARVITRKMLDLGAPVRVEEGKSRPALRDELGSVERERLLDVLRDTGWNLSRAAARLGIPRNTLRYRLDKYGLRGRDASERTTRHEVVAPIVSPDEVSSSQGIRWEPRRLALLCALLVPTSPDRPLLPGRTLDVIGDKVLAFGGHVEDRSPRGLVAAFGLEPVEDAPLRAARTAIALLRAVERTRAEGEAVGIKLAVHVGRFQVGFGSSAVQIDLEAKREAWDVLDALLGRVDVDTVAASEATAKFLERRFELVPLAAPGGDRWPAYRLGSERPSLGMGPRPGTFVGRSHNLELLRSQMAAAVRGQGQVIGIVGDAGIGKSRLIAEFRRSLAAQEVIFLEGTCFSYANAIPYLPVVELLRQSFGITESETSATIVAKIVSSLDALGLTPAESAPYLLQLFGLRKGVEQVAAFTPEAIRLRTMETLRQMILSAARRQPVVVVIEDLHWIDKPSEEVFASLISELPGAPVMFVSTYRPGYRPPWIDKSFATQMALSPLSTEESATILRAVLQRQIPETMARAILTKAEGNPFFLEEICRAVEQEGTGAFTLVPDTVEEILGARIDRLPDAPKRVLQAAAVLGREFALSLLQTVWSDPDSLASDLAVLTGLEFLYPRTDRGELVYVFRHALTQDVAYGGLTPAQRLALHAAAGRALEILFADRLEEAYDRLAYHYAKTDVAAKAVDYLSRFSEKAARSGAHEEAIQAVKTALLHVEGLPAEVRDRRRLELVLRLPLSLLPLGRVAEVCEILLQERERLARLQDAALAGRYHFLLARAYMLADHALVVESAGRAIAEAERCGDEATMGSAYGVLAVACALSGQAARGIECGQRAVTLLEKTNEQWSLSYAYWALGLCCSQTGAFQDGLAAAGKALAIAQAIGDPGLETSATWVPGIIHAAMGEWDEGIAECRLAVQRARNVLYKAIGTGFLGFAYMEKNDAGNAVAALEYSIPLLEQFGLRTFAGWFTAFLAEARRLQGRLDEAATLAEQAKQVAVETNFSVAVGWAQQSLGRIAAARGDLIAAEARLHDALAVFTATSSRYECARTRLDLAALGRTRGDPDVARRHLVEAYRLFKAIGVPRYCERVEGLADGWTLRLTLPAESSTALDTPDHG